MNKVKKTHKFFNVVVDDDLFKDIRELREAGVNWQALTRSFLQVKATELKTSQVFNLK